MPQAYGPRDRPAIFAPSAADSLVGAKIYRVWCEDGPRHEGLTGDRLLALVHDGEVDLEDRVALQGSEQWARAWEIDGLFDAAVVHALRVRREPIERMCRSIRGGWLSLMEYRRQRDELLQREPGVAGSPWVARPRPDLVRAGAQEALVQAAAAGAEAEARSARSPTRAGTPATVTRRAEMTGSFEAVRVNVKQILRGDLPGWAEPETFLMEIRRHGAGVAFRAALLALLLDPLEPVMHAQQWLLGLSGLVAAGAIILQLSLPPSSHAGVHRAARMLLACGVIAVVSVVGKSIDVHHGLIGHFWPAMAGWQDRLASWLQELMQRLGPATAGTTAA